MNEYVPYEKIEEKAGRIRASEKNTVERVAPRNKNKKKLKKHMTEKALEMAKNTFQELFCLFKNICRERCAMDDIE